MGEKSFLTSQEEFWAGTFGDDYVARNQSATLHGANLALFSKILARTGPVATVLELGANIGMNLLALRALCPTLEATAVEINASAVQQLKTLPFVTPIAGSLLTAKLPAAFDLTLSKGVLIHIDPEQLPTAYRQLYLHSRRFICVCEYYNPAPMEVTYRGHTGKLFKRDFAGELLDTYPDLRLVDYGFSYHRDPTFPQDDMSWFLLEKSGS